MAGVPARRLRETSQAVTAVAEPANRLTQIIQSLRLYGIFIVGTKWFVEGARAAEPVVGAALRVGRPSETQRVEPPINADKTLV